MKKFQGVLDAQSEVYTLTVIIRAVGIFSKAIEKLMGEEHLKKFFLKLVEIGEMKVIRAFNENDKSVKEKEEEEKELQNQPRFVATYRTVLYKQKQLNSFIISYANIVSSLKSISEKESQVIFFSFC